MADLSANDNSAALGPTDSTAGKLTHFWVCSSPFFESTLLSSSEPAPHVSAEQDIPPSQSDLRVFDADGCLVNEVSVFVEPGKVSAIELDTLMGGCKFESGMRHAHLEVSSSSRLKHLCRLHTREGASIMSDLLNVSGTRRTFFPLILGKDRLCLLPLVNLGDTEVSIRGRLFCGNRSPEISWNIGPRATRLLELNTEFEEYFDFQENRQAAAYLRLGVKGEYTVGTQLIERSKGKNEGTLFSGLS